MNTQSPPSSSGFNCVSPETIDFLPSIPRAISFAVRVRGLALSSALELKILGQDAQLGETFNLHQIAATLTANDEKELAGEVLRHRHLFTERLLCAPLFRQAALTVIQNIYLFRNRKIFFGTCSASVENERQEALALFSTSSPSETSIPLAKTFQHLLIARVWRRIVSQAKDEDFDQPHFSALLEVVDKLNTLRNIYVLLTKGLVQKLASQTKPLYRQSVTFDDAVQIGSIGIARAAYRYHPSSGVRFSTFAAHWVFREIQRQALDGRLIRISTNTIEGLAKAKKDLDSDKQKRFANIIASTSTVEAIGNQEDALHLMSRLASKTPSPAIAFENAELRQILLQTIALTLPAKTGDIIKRRFGLSPYQGQEQSILSISKKYRVTRSSIYQLEQSALKKLHFHLRERLL